MGLRRICDSGPHPTYWYDADEHAACPICVKKDAKFRRDCKRVGIWLRRQWRQLVFWFWG